MKGKNVENAIEACLAVLGTKRDEVSVRVIKEGRPAVLGMIGGEEAEVEVVYREGKLEEAKQVVQAILNKMGFLAIVEGETDGEGYIKINVKGEDMGRIIGKEGAMLKSLEVIAVAMLRKIFMEPVRIRIDAGGYYEKRTKSLERLAEEIAKEVAETGKEKLLPFMNASDRRDIHLYLKSNNKVKTESSGEGKERRLVVYPNI
jgi:spoIIIJ-associated protein